MAPLFRYRLSDDEKDALLCEQAALIERQAARIAELEALLARPKKTSRNSHTPPSQDWKLGGGEKESTRRKPRPLRPGLARPLADAPDETIKRRASACPHCAVDVSGQRQTCREMLKRMAAQSGIETPSADDLVADKGYHSRAVLKDLDGASGARRGREAARQWQHRRWIEPMEVLR